MNTTAFLRLSFVWMIVLLFAGCDSSATGKKPTEAQLKIKELNEDQLFAGDIVRQFLAQKIPFVAEANKLFLEALNVHKNNKDPYRAIPLFVQSICKNPVSRSYYEMGNACLDAKDYDRAIQCYEMAEKLGYEPFSKVLYNLACAHSLNEDYEQSAQYLQYSLQAGYSNLENIDRDPDLKPLKENDGYAYRDAIRVGTQGMSNAGTLFWLQFKKPFVKVKLPYAIHGEKRAYKEDQHIAYDFEKYIAEMRDDKFSRDVNHEFYYVAEVTSTDQYVAFIYAVEEPFMESLSPIVYRLVTFTAAGKLIDKHVIAGRELLDQPVRMAVVNKDLSIDIKVVELEYMKDPEEAGYEDNPVKSRKQTGEERLRINADGTIMEETLQEVTTL